MDGDAIRDALAFIYPQEDDSYLKRPWPPASHLVSVKRLEELARAEFLPGFPKDKKDKVQLDVWSVEKKFFDPSCKRFAGKDDDR